MADLVAVNSAEVTTVLSRALTTQPDVAALFRYSRAAGSRDWFLLSSVEEYHAVAAMGRPDDSLALFLSPQFPLRGVVDDRFTASCLSLFQQVTDYSSELVLGVRNEGSAVLTSCESIAYTDRTDLDAWLLEHRGEIAVAGLHPDLFAEDSEDLLVVYVPRADGTVQAGIY